MPYAKDWRRYDPTLQFVVIKFKKTGGKVMEATFETAMEAHVTRNKLYAFFRALKSAPKADTWWDKEKGENLPIKELYETTRGMKIMLRSLDGETINFVTGYAGPVKLVICPVGDTIYTTKGDAALRSFGEQVGAISSEAELLDPNRDSLQRLIAVQEEMNAKQKEQERLEADPSPPTLPLETIEVKRSPKKAPEPSLIQTDEPLIPKGEERDGYSAEEVGAALKNQYYARILDNIEKAAPEKALALALRQKAIFKEGTWHEEASEWLRVRGRDGLNS